VLLFCRHILQTFCWHILPRFECQGFLDLALCVGACVVGHCLKSSWNPPNSIHWDHVWAVSFELFRFYIINVWSNILLSSKIFFLFLIIFWKNCLMWYSVFWQDIVFEIHNNSIHSNSIHDNIGCDRIYQSLMQFFTTFRQSVFSYFCFRFNILFLQKSVFLFLKEIFWKKFFLIYRNFRITGVSIKLGQVLKADVLKAAGLRHNFKYFQIRMCVFFQTISNVPILSVHLKIVSEKKLRNTFKCFLNVNKCTHCRVLDCWSEQNSIFFCFAIFLYWFF